MTDKSLGLYLHIPFCKRKCVYCDFCSYAGREGDMPRYVDALVREMARRPAEGYTVRTVYLGGGTPSLLGEGELSRLLSAVRAHYRVAEDAEITCEVNPGTTDYDKFSLLKSLGVNRVSLGVQSLSDRALRALGRIHTAEGAVTAYRAARRAGFSNISLDLMTGLPGETPAELSSTVSGLVALGPEHISAYALSVEEGTPLATSPIRRTIPDEDAAADAMELASSMLADAGYLRYEISNYARAGYESRHNLTYWRGGEYVGLGVAAYSYFGGERFGTPRELDAYLRGEALPRCDLEVITQAERERERVMLSLRLREGIGRARYLREFGRDPLALFREVTLRYPDCFFVTDTAIALTDRGMNLSNPLIGEMLALL